jgi:mono/diheme cytochrome c family protein
MPAICHSGPSGADHATDTPAGARRILAFIGASAHGQDGDITAGHAFAREACNACHIVEAKPQKPRRIVIGPAFRDIANTRGMTATALRVFLTTSHPKMPNLILTPEEITDASAYILSLRNRPPS